MRLKLFILWLLLLGHSLTSSAQGSEGNSAPMPSAVPTNTVIQNNEEKQRNEAPKTVQDLEEISIKANQKKTSSFAKNKDKVEVSAIRVEQLSLLSNLSLQWHAQAGSRSPSIEQRKVAQQALVALEAVDASSFEYHFYSYVFSYYDVSKEEHLMKAYSLQPENKEVLRYFAAHAFIKNRPSDLKLALQKLFQLGALTSSGQRYAKHLLATQGNQSVLLSHGFEDTYHLLYEQTVHGGFNEVQIVPVDFLQSEYYRKELQQKGFQMPQQQTVDVAFVKAFCALNGAKRLSLSMTFPKVYLQAISEHSYLLGLSFLYRNDPIVTTHDNVRFFEQWQEDIQRFAENEDTYRLNANYLPFLLVVKNYYEVLDQPLVVKQLEEYIQGIAKSVKKERELQEFKKTQQ